MNLIEQVQALKEQVQTVAEILGGNAVCVQFALAPQTFEDSASKDENRWNWNNIKLWNQAAATRKAAEMVAEGWTQHWDTDMGAERNISLGFDPDVTDNQPLLAGRPTQLRVLINYIPSVEEKCAELKKQLAELGCHY